MVMKFNGVELILDNFRSVLSDYSLDVQDVVRSAILDGIDISEFIEVCRNNPYRLDQIRLSKKEGIDSLFFKIKSGESLYKIRQLREKGVSLTGIVSQIKQGILSDDSLNKLISWVSSGYKIDGINISIIPKSLFEVFEQGFQRGFDMKVFNDGRNYKPEYIRYCLVISSNGKNINPFVSSEGMWEEDCIKQLAIFSKVRSQEKWDNLLKYIDWKVQSDKLGVLISCVKNNIDITELSNSEWSPEGIKYIIKAYESGLDYQSLIKCGPDENIIMTRLNQMMLNKSKRVSGRLRKS